jgi:hypothetical protein
MLFTEQTRRTIVGGGANRYKANSELAQWNNEGDTFNQTYKDNFGKVKRFAMIKALKDTMVYPNEGEWWGHFEDGSLKTVLPMNQTRWHVNTYVASVPLQAVLSVSAR